MDGGAMTEQDSLASARSSKSLSLLYDTSLQFLSIAVASWGPGNCAAYLKRYGKFGSKIIVMVVSSHDAYDLMTFNPAIGINPLYPEKQYKLALHEAFDRLFHKLFSPIHDNLGMEVEGKVFNSGFSQILLISKQLRIPLIIYLHATIGERKNVSYSLQRKKIIEFSIRNNINLIKELDYKLPKMIIGIYSLKMRRVKGICMILFTRYSPII